MVNQKIETSFQFPYFKYVTDVSYLEVKKPTGVEYLLLVLIDSSKTKDDYLANVLLNFDIPKTLHVIFHNAIRELYNNKIITISTELCLLSTYFDKIRIKDLSFTSDGKKVFATEAIPTGITKEVKLDIYYDIAKNELAFNIDKDKEPKPLMNSVISPEMLTNFVCKKDIEDFLNLNKGKTIPLHDNARTKENVIIKQEEVINKVETIDSTFWVAKYDSTINITDDTLTIEFDEEILNKFFNNFYNSNMINGAIAFKNKFKFIKTYSKNLKLSSYGNIIDSIMLPKELANILKSKGKLFITKGNYVSDRILNITYDLGLNNFDNNLEFIIVDQADNIYGYVPGEFVFNCNNMGDINIPLLLKLKLTNEDLKNILNPFINSLNTYSDDNIKTLIEVTSVSKDYDLAKSIINNYVSSDLQTNILLLNQMRSLVIKDKTISVIYKEILEINYNNYLATITEDNLDTILNISKYIPDQLKLSRIDVLNKIFTNLKTVNNSVYIYQTLIKYGFNKENIVDFVNPIVADLNSYSDLDKSLLDYLNFNNKLAELKTLTNVSNVSNYHIDDKTLNKPKFQELYNKLAELYKNIKFFAKGNDTKFNEYNTYMEIFKQENDYLNLLKNTNASKVNKDVLLKKIDNGDYQYVLINLASKLESILQNNYNLAGSLADMLNEARNTSVINKDIISDLHLLRENRNALAHPNDRTANYNADDLRKWVDEVFNLEVK